MYANRLPLDTCFCSSPLPPLATIGRSEQKQMTLAKYCNSLPTELGPIYTSSHRNCLLIEFQKLCCLFDPRGLVFFILWVVLSATLEVIFFFFLLRPLTFPTVHQSSITLSHFKPSRGDLTLFVSPTVPCSYWTALFSRQRHCPACDHGI